MPNLVDATAEAGTAIFVSGYLSQPSSLHDQLTRFLRPDMGAVRDGIDELGTWGGRCLAKVYAAGRYGERATCGYG